MGNLCSKSSNPSDPFAEPGRVLGANADATAPSRAPLPQKKIGAKAGVVKGGRTLGASGGASGQNEEARSAAARAAEVSFMHSISPQIFSPLDDGYSNRAFKFYIFTNDFLFF